ncbi:MAG TPA: hypothetical protein VMT16_12350 [Thermoanaerobaculia bacterium]|nr:hypothetical protein [Thermoanaerobaculia bacterium]
MPGGRAARTAAGWLALVGLLLGCTPIELLIEPATEAERLPVPAFRVLDASRAQAPLYDQVKVLDVSGPCGDSGCPVVWWAAAAGEQGPRLLRYGDSRLAQRVAPRPLRARGRYQLLVWKSHPVWGLLADGKLSFRVAADGSVIAEEGVY